MLVSEWSCGRLLVIINYRFRGVFQGFERRFFSYLLTFSSPTPRLPPLAYINLPLPHSFVHFPFCKIFLGFFLILPSLPLLKFPFPSRLFFLLSLFSLIMPKDGDDNSDGLGESDPTLWEAKLTKADERRIRM